MSGAATTLAVETRQLTKDYGGGRGCHDVSLQIGNGEAFGFLGPNGAGKSTVVKMLTGLIEPTEGEAFIFGRRAGSIEARKRIGFLPELFRYPEWLTGEEALLFHAKLSGLDRRTARQRAAALLEEVGIGKRGRDRIKGYSKGMQQRLGLACALVGEPDLLFLDEPTSALDPVGRHEVKQLLIRLKRRGTTIFLNSHLLEDVEQLCDRVALLNNGRILRSGTLAEVLREQSRWHVRIGGLTPALLQWIGDMMETPARVLPDKAVPEGSDSVWVELGLGHEELAARLNYLLAEQGLSLYEAVCVRTRLNDWFIDAVAGMEHRGERG